MPKTDPPTDQFSEILNELTDFQDYFTEDSKINELVEYIYAETGIPKAGIRLVIKRIAPFLASTVGVPMLNKLHGKLSQYDVYLTVSQRLLNSLKTMGDKSLDIALDIPSNEHLESLITDKAKWENLKSEHQGLVQLLLGQNSLSDDLDNTRQSIEAALQRQLDSLVNMFSFDLDLKTPDVLIAETQDAEAGSARWLTFGHKQARLIGRNNSLQQLRDFFDQEISFAWWAITGSGGVGKSRLALEAIEHRQTLWDVGFLPHVKLKKDDALGNWKPQLPTIIVIDYAAEYPEAIRDWIDYFIQHWESFDFPVRLLILERECKSQSWWEQLVDDGSGGALNRKKYLFTQAPLELKPLTLTEQRTTLESFLESLSCNSPLPEDENTFWGNLSLLSNKGRPLFIGMVAVAIAEHGIHHLREWNQEELLNYVLKHEKSAWNRQLKEFSLERKETIYQLLAFTTATSRLNFDNSERLYKKLKKCEFGVNDSEVEDNINAVLQLTGGESGYLQPDIFGEYFVLQQWHYSDTQPNHLLNKRLLTAQKLYPENIHLFLSRTAVDYPKNETPFRWWKLLEKSAKNNSIRLTLTEVSFDIIGRLSLYGYYTEALVHWLSPLRESEELQIKASALNTTGIQHYHLGNYNTALDSYQKSLAITRGIIDKHGEASALNNISEIYRTRGDYKNALTCLKESLIITRETNDRGSESATLNNLATTAYALRNYEDALDYLYESLAITQEVGNKAGEGTTLNNISQIYDIRGDKKTALNYLKRSLAIQQEIGDKFGEARSFNNISQIYQAQRDYETALVYLEQSLEIRLAIGDKSGEGTTLNNISLIFSSRGDDEIALNYLQRSLLIQQEVGNIEGECMAKFNIGLIFQRNGKAAEALKLWTETYKTAKKLGLENILETLDLKLKGGLKVWETALENLDKSKKLQ